jgi:hypothetical protein
MENRNFAEIVSGFLAASLAYFSNFVDSRLPPGRANPTSPSSASHQKELKCLDPDKMGRRPGRAAAKNAAAALSESTFSITHGA